MRRRGSNSRILRPIAVVLATTGLLGHGLAMLLVGLLGLLAQPAAAGTGGLYLDEICTADGLVRLAGQSPGDANGGSDPHHTPIEGCLICTAFAQGAAADLPSAAEISPPQCCGAAHRPDHASASRLPVRPAAQPRAPPARA